MQVIVRVGHRFIVHNTFNASAAPRCPMYFHRCRSKNVLHHNANFLAARLHPKHHQQWRLSRSKTFRIASVHQFDSNSGHNLVRFSESGRNRYGKLRIRKHTIRNRFAGSHQIEVSRFERQQTIDNSIFNIRSGTRPWNAESFNECDHRNRRHGVQWLRQHESVGFII